jgi:HPt (histidine-containing phosphotransfer) domain-containing protein
MINKELIKASYLMDDEQSLALLKLFQESSINDLIDLDAGIENKDYSIIIKYSHKLKSGAAYIFLESLSALFKQIETYARAEANFSDIKILVDKSKYELEQIFREVDNFSKSFK